MRANDKSKVLPIDTSAPRFLLLVLHKGATFFHIKRTLPRIISPAAGLTLEYTGYIIGANIKKWRVSIWADVGKLGRNSNGKDLSERSCDKFGAGKQDSGKP